MPTFTMSASSTSCIAYKLGDDQINSEYSPNGLAASSVQKSGDISEPILAPESQPIMLQKADLDQQTPGIWLSSADGDEPTMGESTWRDGDWGSQVLMKCGLSITTQQAPKKKHPKGTRCQLCQDAAGKSREFGAAMMDTKSYEKMYDEFLKDF